MISKTTTHCITVLLAVLLVPKNGSLFGGSAFLAFGDELTNEDGCCTLDFKKCIDWCGPTKDSCMDCNHHDGVGWLPNGSNQDKKCKKRWKGCKNDKNGCCDGLTCKKNENKFWACSPSATSEFFTRTPTQDPTASPTTMVVPTKTPTETPSTAPPTAPPTETTTEGEDVDIDDDDEEQEGCCSLDFKTCIDWCGPTKDSCLNCNHHDGVGWLPKGPSQDKCKKRWKGCKNNKNGCCDGLTCQKDDNDFLMCLPSPLSEVSSSSPTPSPTILSTEKTSNGEEENDENGCCSLDFKTCINWCGPTKDSCLNCDHHDGVSWLSNGPQEQCKKRWKGCKNDKNGCCDGLTCQKDDNKFWACLPSFLSEVSSPPTPSPITSPNNTEPPIESPAIDTPPITSPSESPTAKPTKNDIGGEPENGCCSLNFMKCIDWCGSTKDSCLTCNHHDGVGWLENGPPQEKCKKRWKGCKKAKNSCCDGLTCQKDDNKFWACLPSFLPEKTASPTDPMTSPPTAEQTTSPTASPTFTPTLSPTPVPTPEPTPNPTESPTSSPTASPTVSPTDAPTNAPTDAPTDAPTASPTDTPTILATSTSTSTDTSTGTNSASVSVSSSSTFLGSSSGSITSSSSGTSTGTSEGTAQVPSTRMLRGVESR